MAEGVKKIPPPRTSPSTSRESDAYICLLNQRAVQKEIPKCDRLRDYEGRVRVLVDALYSFAQRCKGFLHALWMESRQLRT